MRFIFGQRHALYFVRILQSFARISEDVRLVSSSNSIRIEMVKDPVVFGTITLPNTFFEFFSADEEPIDVIFTSQSIQLIFRNASHFAKKMQRMDVTIQKDEDFAVFRLSMSSYERISHIPFQNRYHIRELNYGDYESYPVRLNCLVKLLTDGIRHFPASIELVTFRIRSRDVKCETGDEEAVAEYMTTFKFFTEEFDQYDRTSDVTVTFSLKYLRQFLSAWDKKSHNISSFFKAGGAGVVLELNCAGFTTRLMLSTVAKDHPPNSPVRTGNETTQSVDITYLTNSASAGNVSMNNETIGNGTASHVTNSGLNVTLDQSTHSGDQSMSRNEQAVEEEEFEFDDSYDEAISMIPDPVPTEQARASTSRQAERHPSDECSLAGATQSLSNVAPENHSTLQSYDTQVYRALLDEWMLGRSRKVCGLDETIPSDVRNRPNDEPDDESDDEYVFGD